MMLRIVGRAAGLPGSRRGDERSYRGDKRGGGCQSAPDAV